MYEECKLKMSDYLKSEHRKTHKENDARRRTPEENVRRNAAIGEICRLGDFCQSAYDGFDSSGLATDGGCKYTKENFLVETGVHKFGYDVTHFLFADEFITVGSLYTVKRVWIGYVCVCTSDAERERLGGWEILVVLRGTVTPYEWIENLKFWSESATAGKVTTGFAGLFEGFRDVLLAAVQSNLDGYAEQGRTDVSITVTGHSLGGALAILAADHLASNLREWSEEICVVTFGAPRVGNKVFKDRLEMRVNVLRVEVVGDIVPGLPCSSIGGGRYEHAGRVVRVSPSTSPYLKECCNWNFGQKWKLAHNLQVALHLVDGDRGSGQQFKARFRDFATVNKETAYLKEEFEIPRDWGANPTTVEKYDNRTCFSLGIADLFDERLVFSTDPDKDAITNSLAVREGRLRAVFVPIKGLFEAISYAFEVIHGFFKNGCRDVLGMIKKLCRIIFKYWHECSVVIRRFLKFLLSAIIAIFTLDLEAVFKLWSEAIGTALDALSEVYYCVMTAWRNHENVNVSVLLKKMTQKLEVAREGFEDNLLYLLLKLGIEVSLPL